MTVFITQIQKVTLNSNYLALFQSPAARNFCVATLMTQKATSVEKCIAKTFRVEWRPTIAPKDVVRYTSFYFWKHDELLP